MAQASATGEEPAWAGLAWVAAELMIDTMISATIGHLTGDVKDLGVLPVQARIPNLDLRLQRQPLQAQNSAAYLAETARRRIPGPHPLSPTASATSLQTRVVTVLCSVSRPVRWQATPRRLDLYIPPARVTTCSLSLENPTISAAIVAPIPHPTSTILASHLDTRDVTVSSSLTIFHLCHARRQVTLRRMRIRKTAMVTAAAGSSMFLVDPTRRTTPSLQHRVYSQRTLLTKT